LLTERPACDVAKIKVFSRDEKKHYDMKNELEALGLPPVEHIIGDVRDYSSLRRAVMETEYVIHAAAMKHITHCEMYPEQATLTNVDGAKNLVRALLEAGGKYTETKVLFVSTDKAVDPINTYGMCKAIQERVFQKAGLLRCVGVRYGNVLSSSGSVVPFFRSLAQAGKTLPLTDTRMTRFFITFNEAVNLIFKALEKGETNSISVPILRSARVEDIASAFSTKYGVPINIVGARPGEKIHEVLLNTREFSTCVRKDNYVEIPSRDDPFTATTPTISDPPLKLSDFSSDGPLMSAAEVQDFLEKNNQL
jgi:UDP-N-acetylglucosamine 4,6-dehydratase